MTPAGTQPWDKGKTSARVKPPRNLCLSLMSRRFLSHLNAMGQAQLLCLSPDMQRLLPVLRKISDEELALLCFYADTLR